MDILQKAVEYAVQQIAGSAASDELERFVDALPEKLQELLGNLPIEVLSTIKGKAHEGLEERRADHSLFVERNISRWGKGFDLLELLIEIAIEAGESFNRRLRPAAAEKGDLVFDILVRLHAKGCLTSKEILSLLKDGYADGAHARWRALHEVSVTAMFLAKHGVEAARSYTDFEIVEAYKGASQLNQYEARVNASGFSEEEMKEFKKQYNLVIDKHGSEFKKPYGWSRRFLPKGTPTFFALEKDVGLDHWRPYYRWASQNIHANVKTIRNSLGLCEATEGILQVGPSNSGMTDPAHSTAISLAQLTRTTLFHSPNLDDLVVAKMLLALSDEVGEVFLECDKEATI